MKQGGVLFCPLPFIEIRFNFVLPSEEAEEERYPVYVVPEATNMEGISRFYTREQLRFGVPQTTG